MLSTIMLTYFCFAAVLIAIRPSLHSVGTCYAGTSPAAMVSLNTNTLVYIGSTG